MNAEIFAEWLRRQGHRVHRTASSYWCEFAPHVCQAFPCHWTITPSEAELRELMVGQRIIALRYSAPLDFPIGKVSYHVVLHAPYSLDGLKANTRNGIKCGLRHFTVEQIPFERLATEGWALQQDTLARQDRLRSMKQAEWARLCRAAEGLPGFEAWAATSCGQLASAVIVCRIDDRYDVPFALSHSTFLGEHVNNALFYTVSCDLLGRDGVSGIFFTVQSLDAPASVDDFKFRMGLMPKAVRQRVEFHPWLKPLISPAVHGAVQKLFKRDPSNPTLAKAEGMLRFYIEGKRSITEQTWPECVAMQKEPCQPALAG